MAMPLENEMQTDATQTSNPPSNAPPPSNNLNDALLKTELHPSAHLANQHNDDERLHSIVHSHPCLSDESTNAKSSLKISSQFTDNLVPEVVIFHSASSTVPLATNTPSCIDGNEGDGAVLIPKDEGELQCVFIENLARPFVSDALTSLLSKYGKIGEFWINRIKTHCYVSFATCEESSLAIRSLQHLQWPPETGKPLKVTLLSRKAMNECVQQDQKSQVALCMDRPRLVAPTERAVRSVTDKECDKRALELEKQRALDSGHFRKFRRTLVKPVIYFKPCIDIIDK